MAEKHRARGLNERWIGDIEAFVASLPALAEWPAEAVFLHNDLHLAHIHLALDGPAPRICGLLDFADAQVGAREVEFVTAGAFLAPRDPGAASVFLRAYGMPREALTPELARRLTGHVLLHRYCDVAPILGRFPEEGRPPTLEALHQRMWDFA
jgi:aminoglycoside phosphotransferase (APT) family kinase protein